MRRVCLLAFSAVVGCSDNSVPAIQVDENLTTTASARPDPPPPATTTAQPARKHNYDFKEDDVYGYIAGVSDEEHKRGKAAGDVVMYRYAGFWNGAYHLERVLDGGAIVAVAECTKPCVAIKFYDRGSVTRIAYNPASVIGAAFEDAMNGQLIKKRPPPPSPNHNVDAELQQVDASPPPSLRQPEEASDAEVGFNDSNLL